MSASYLSNDGNDRSDRSVAPLGALRRFTREREPARPPMEHCELCSETIAPDHQHLLDLSSRTVVCACQACSLLFSEQGAGGGKYKRVPRRYLALPDFRMTDEQWDELMIPVNMIYIFHSTMAKGAVAFYPSPAGATESLLNLDSWETLVSSNPILNDLESDVEALLINRVKDTRQYYIVPIDACYQLVGLIRISWKGLSGGEEAWKAIAEFFTDLRAKSQPVRGEDNARPEL
ncbi:MAG TPA: DUF5947 family protein [Ktedonobacteraceae bacterium]